MAKRKGVRKTRGAGTKLAGKKMRGKGFVDELIRTQGPGIIGSVVGEMLKLGLSRAMAPKK